MTVEVGPRASGTSVVGAKVAPAVGQTIADNTQATLVWGAEEFDTGGFHDNSTNPERITLDRAGYWEVGIAVDSEGALTAAGRIVAVLFKNGTTTRVAGGTFEGANKAGQNGGVQGSTIAYFDAGDYVLAQLYHLTGGNFVTSTTFATTRMWAVYRGN